MSINDITVAEFFPEMGGFAHRDIFEGIQRPWEVLGKINDYIVGFLPDGKTDCSLPAGLRKMDGPGKDAMLYCEEPLLLESDLFCAPLKIRIGAGTKIEPTAVIKGPTLIGAECDIRQGAYLRGGLIAGNHCTLGHVTEIKNSILMNHSEAGHFNYIGDSVIGSYVNLGAGTKLANLKFRGPDDKRKIAFPVISFTVGGEVVNTGISKFGSIIGDHSETGCNAVINPAVLLGVQCWVYPNITVKSGVYAPKSVIRR